MWWSSLLGRTIALYRGGYENRDAIKAELRLAFVRREKVILRQQGVRVMLCLFLRNIPPNVRKPKVEVTPLQDPFQPSSTPLGDARRYLCWNGVGTVISVDEVMMKIPTLIELVERNTEESVPVPTRYTLYSSNKWRNMACRLPKSAQESVYKEERLDSRQGLFLSFRC